MPLYLCTRKIQNPGAFIFVQKVTGSHKKVTDVTRNAQNKQYLCSGFEKKVRFLIYIRFCGYMRTRTRKMVSFGIRKKSSTFAKFFES